MDFSNLHSFGSKQESRKMERIEETVQIVEGAGLYPSYETIASAGTEATCVIGGRERVMLCSNNYLGLARHDVVVEEAKRLLDLHGVGPGGSRFLCGNVDVLPELDRKVAELVGAEDAITFPTGYMANLGVFRALLDPLLGVLPYRKGAAAVIADERNHATVLDGIDLSHAKRFLFAHNDVDDLARKLERAKGRHPKMIVTEGVFSLDGEVTPLPEIVAIAERYDAILMIDDAHGIGVMGARGGGTLQHFGLQGRADIVMGSFDKALGGMGGFLAGRKEIVRYLRVAARPYMFSSAVPAVMAGAMIRAIEMCMNGGELRARLRTNAAQLRSDLAGLGFKILGNGDLPVVSVLIGSEEAAITFSNRVYALGVFVPCFRWPAVPKGTARIRATVTALHEREHLARVVDAFRIARDELGVLAAAA